MWINAALRCDSQKYAATAIEQLNDFDETITYKSEDRLILTSKRHLDIRTLVDGGGLRSTLFYPLLWFKILRLNNVESTSLRRNSFWFFIQTLDPTVRFHFYGKTHTVCHILHCRFRRLIAWSKRFGLLSPFLSSFGQTKKMFNPIFIYEYCELLKYYLQRDSAITCKMSIYLTRQIIIPMILVNDILDLNVKSQGLLIKLIFRRGQKYIFLDFCTMAFDDLE